MMPAVVRRSDLAALAASPPCVVAPPLGAPGMVVPCPGALVRLPARSHWWHAALLRVSKSPQNRTKEG